MATDTWQRFNDAWRARSGLKDLDHPTFSGVSRVWRAVLHPTFHDDVAVTVTELDRGGFIELRVVPADARTLSMLDAGLRVGGPLPEATPGVWEAALPSAALEALAAQMPRLPLHSTNVGRDGMTVDHEALVDGAVLRFSSWSPTRASAPLHHAYVVALCTLAARTFSESAAQAAVQPLAGYLR